MKAAKPVEKDNKNHQNQSKKQKAKKPMVVPLPVVEVANIQIQKSEQSVGNAGFTNPNTNMNLNGVIPPVHGSQTIYDQGAEVMYKRHQESLAETGDINHPDTKKMEKGYMSTLNINQGQDYNNLKSGTHLPKNLEEQAAVYQESKKTQKVNTVANTVEKPAAKKNIVNQVAVVGEDLSQSINSDKETVTDTEVKTSTNAKSNPAFTELSGRINTTAKLQKQHEPSNKATNDAQAAAPSPANERQSMAQASQVNTMDAQEAGMFKKEDFKALLSKKIHNIKLPENEAQADEFEKHNNIEEVNKKAVGDVKKEKNAASNDIASATAAQPNTNAQPVRAVAKMPTPNVGKAPGTPNVGKAMPVKRDAGSVEQPIKEQTASIDSEMKANGVTDSMLAKSNEPSFTDALDQKNKAKNQSVTATQQFRNKENNELSQTRNDAQTQADHHIGGMHSARKGGLGNVHGEQKQTSAKDGQKRKEIADHINGIYQSSKTDVNSILNNLDKTVAEKFDKGSQVAKKEFEKHVDKEMNAYKIRRYKKAGMSYGDMAALGLFVWDKLTGLPDEINKYFDSGKALYIRIMDRFIDDIATYVTNQLNAAKTRISKGKKEVQTYVNSLSPSLRKIGKDAIAEIQSKFNALEESVNSKKEALIDVLAKKYADNIASIDTRIADLKSQNSGLVNQALNVLKNSVFAIIIEIKNTLANLLSGVMDAIQAIIMDPIGFFKNLIAGVSQGFTNFGTNIWTHLKTGFFGWLTGAMKGISLTMPEDVFSLKGVFSITTQVLGLTWGGIRAIGSRVIGEPVMKVLETGFEMVQVVRKEGVAGLWEHLKDQFADLKTTVMDTIMDIIQSQVIQAGIKWVMGLLTPVGAFIKAAMAIIDVVKFFIQRAAQIMELVKAFTDSIKAIASGNVGAVAKSIENALGRAVPVLIGFLASLLGIGGLADKVLGIIRKIRQRIENAIVKFWNFVKGKAKKLLGKIGFGGAKEAIKDSTAKEIENDPNKDWDDIQIPFEGEDHHRHTLYFQDKGGQTILMVASTPTSFTDFVESIKPRNDDDRTKDAKAKAISIAAKIEARKKDRTDGKKANEKTKKEDIAKMTRDLSKYVAILFGIDKEGGLPESIIKHMSKSIGGGILATAMGASPLTRNGIEGSDPKQTNTVYNDLFYRKEGDRAYYVRGHLLNENIHGEGILTNLTPLSQKGNSNHLRAAEEPIKTAVLGGAIVDYFLTVNYGRSVPSVTDDQLEEAGFESEKDKKIIRKIRDAEKFVPQGLMLKSNYLKKEGGKYVKDKELINKNSIINPVDLELKNYKIDSDRQVKVSIKYSTPEEIETNTDLNLNQATIMHKAANLVPSLTKFTQIIPKLPEVTTDKRAIVILTEIIENRQFGGKLVLKEIK